MRIEIWSDLVCPWCYVGKRRFERAVARFEQRQTLDVVHRSFQLNPMAPRDRTTDRQEMLRAKYSLSAAKVAEMDARMTEIAAAEGLHYALDGTVSGNTFDAHQVVHLGGARGRQDAVIERLYRGYFEEHQSIFDRRSLVALAADAGLDPVETATALEEGRYATAVQADMESARRLGITGVPFFVFDDLYGVSGAQSPDVFLDALTRAGGTASR